MKTALITTTINIPRVLELYRRYGPDVRFFVAGDKKTPQAAFDLCDSIPYCFALRPTAQTDWACSELLGWSTIGRRNIALLEALKWGAEIIVTIDDDNIPYTDEYFTHFWNYLSPGSFFGIKASSPTGWFDVGTLLQPQAPHRGFPHTQKAPATFSHVVDARIGVAAGICLGDPDIGAVERIANSPTVHGVSELLRAGIVTDPRETWTVFNSQNTAFIRELAPAMFMLPGVGRYDDIFASLITQRVMRERGYHVHFGQPFVWQQRNPHDLIKDLKAELLGMERVGELAHWLDDFVFTPDHQSVLEQVRYIYEVLPLTATWMPEIVSKAGLAWCDDIEKVL